MEREFYTDEFEQLIKEKSDQFRMYPSKRVWHSIYNNLHPSRRWPSFAISVLFFTSLVSIGYLNTSDNSRNFKFTGSSSASTVIAANNVTKNENPPIRNKNTTEPVNNNTISINSLSKPETINDADPSGNNPGQVLNISGISGKNTLVKSTSAKNKTSNIYQPVDDQLTNNSQLFSDMAVTGESNKLKAKKPAAVRENSSKEADDENTDVLNNADSKISISARSSESQVVVPDQQKTAFENESKNVPKILSATESKTDDQEEKSWIENYAQQNKPARSRWKGRLDFELYATPAVNYRKLTTDSKGSAAPFAMTGDINKAISQKPGLGIETGLGLSYAFAKNLRLKAGVQFNYTNYNINADQTNHPIQTSILLTDPVTGYSYPAARVSSIANTYDNNALQPVTLHNRTYQVSMPIGLAYKLSSNKNVEWFAGATVQPSYIFGGKAHLISSDLKNYISDPSTIRNWNLNIGLETYMNYRFGTYSLRVGPQVRYQVYSTYRKDVALIEKPYAVGLKIGIVKGF